MDKSTSDSDKVTLLTKKWTPPVGLSFQLLIVGSIMLNERKITACYVTRGASMPSSVYYL